MKKYMRFYFDDMTYFSPDEEYLEFPAETTDEEIYSTFEFWRDKMSKERFNPNDYIDMYYKRFGDSDKTYRELIEDVKDRYMCSIDAWCEILTAEEYSAGTA